MTVQEAAIDSWMSTAKVTGITHPNDRNKLVELLKRLAAAGYYMRPDEAQGWMTMRGMPAKHSRRAVELIERFNTGAKLKMTDAGPWWTEDIVEIWRNKAATST